MDASIISKEDLLKTFQTLQSKHQVGGNFQIHLLWSCDWTEVDKGQKHLWTSEKLIPDLAEVVIYVQTRMPDNMCDFIAGNAANLNFDSTLH